MISGPARINLKEGGSTNPLINIMTRYKRKLVLEKKVGSRLTLKRKKILATAPASLCLSLSFSLSYAHTQVLHDLEAKMHFAIV